MLRSTSAGRTSHPESLESHLRELQWSTGQSLGTNESRLRGSEPLFVEVAEEALFPEG